MIQSGQCQFIGMSIVSIILYSAYIYTMPLLDLTKCKMQFHDPSNRALSQHIPDAYVQEI